MPKIQTKAAWRREWINRIDGKSIYSTDGKVIFCQPCEKKVFKTTNFFSTTDIDNKQVECTQYSHLQQHNISAHHLKHLKIFNRPSASKQTAINYNSKENRSRPGSIFH
jgi:hypothetical protein